MGISIALPAAMPRGSSLETVGENPLRERGLSDGDLIRRVARRDADAFEILYHRYAIDEKGLIVTAKIVPPTSQNQKRIEDDLREYAARLVAWPLDEATWKCEQAIRNYDPCISCATHFLKLTISRDDGK